MDYLSHAYSRVFVIDKKLFKNILNQVKAERIKVASQKIHIIFNDTGQLTSECKVVHTQVRNQTETYHIVLHKEDHKIFVHPIPKDEFLAYKMRKKPDCEFRKEQYVFQLTQQHTVFTAQLDVWKRTLSGMYVLRISAPSLEQLALFSPSAYLDGIFEEFKDSKEFALILFLKQKKKATPTFFKRIKNLIKRPKHM